MQAQGSWLGFDFGEARIGIAVGDRLVGIVTARDFTNKVLAMGVDPSAPVSTVMAKDPLTLSPDSLGSDILHTMLEHRIGHAFAGGCFLLV